MSLTLAPPSLPASSIAPSLASLRRRPSAGAASSSSARPPSSRLLRVSCLSACHALPPPSIADLGQPPRRGERLSLYEVLRVGDDASAREIKAAYRALAKAYHPDAAREAAGPDGRDFMEIHDAYETLSDPAARALYDLSLGRRRRRAGRGGFCTTRRWETDQCW